MKQKLYSKLCNDAVEAIGMIIDPIEKVKAISSMLPFISKSEETEISDEQEAIKQAVKSQVAEEMQKLEQEEEQKEDEVTNTSETQEKIEAVSENPQNKLDDIVKKYGNETLREAFQNGHAEYLKEEFENVTKFKEKMAKYFEDNNFANINAEDMLNYYMSLVDESSDTLYEDTSTMTIAQFVESFYPFVISLSTIYSYPPQTITKVFSTMTNGRYKEGLNDININNAGALAAALTDNN